MIALRSMADEHPADGADQKRTGAPADGFDMATKRGFRFFAAQADGAGNQEHALATADGAAKEKRK